MNGPPREVTDQLNELSRISIAAVQAENEAIEKVAKARIKELWPHAVKARLDCEYDDQTMWWFLSDVQDAAGESVADLSARIDDDEWVFQIVQELWPVLDWCGVNWIEWDLTDV